MKQQVILGFLDNTVSKCIVMFMSRRMRRKWDSMIGRCHRESHPSYGYYGGRGIKVCERWMGSFEAFFEDMGEAPEGYWLDRIDNSKGYEPGNCRWVTPKESASNRKQRSQVKGSIRQLARSAGMPYQRVIQRVRAGWELEKALNIPVQKRGAMTHHDRMEFGLM